MLANLNHGLARQVALLLLDLLEQGDQGITRGVGIVLQNVFDV